MPGPSSPTLSSATVNTVIQEKNVNKTRRPGRRTGAAAPSTLQACDMKFALKTKC